MATEKTTSKNGSVKPQGDKKMFDFAFGRKNYILMIAGIVVLGIGYLLMTGGGSDNPEVFNYNLFNTRRLVIAPLVILAGIILEIVAIMKKPD